ncbi:MAG TPA: hypothetical protein VMF60_05820, partial [Acidimicrobiales bacterium]|nr:hypothetical protein [Acidimicrobiales bacterium]
MSSPSVADPRRPVAPSAARDRRRAVDVLVDPSLESLVEMVVSSPGPDLYEARCVDGAVRFRRRPTAGGWGFEVEAVEGRHPLG